jgi:hypothetical protein
MDLYSSAVQMSGFVQQRRQINGFVQQCSADEWICTAAQAD